MEMIKMLSIILFLVFSLIILTIAIIMAIKRKGLRRKPLKHESFETPQPKPINEDNLPYDPNANSNYGRDTEYVVTDEKDFTSGFYYIN